MKTTNQDRQELREYDRLRFLQAASPRPTTIPQQHILNKWAPINLLSMLLDDLAEIESRLAWADGLLAKAKSETELLVSYFERDRQVLLHANDVVPDAKKWLASYAAGPEKETKE